MTTHRAVFLSVLVMLFLGNCATHGSPEPGDMPRGRDRGMEGRPQRAMRASAGMELMLPAGWWHDPRLAEPLSLSGEQFQRLEGLREKQDETVQLERDSMVAMRELRTALEARDASAATIVAAGAHYRQLQQVLLERQIELVAAQREILTADQWSTLREKLASEVGPDRGERDPRGRGGFDGRGRGPGGRGGMRPPGGGWGW